jgi:hypothetical protein
MSRRCLSDKRPHVEEDAAVARSSQSQEQAERRLARHFVPRFASLRHFKLTLEQLREPLAILRVGLAATHVLQRTYVDQKPRERLLQHVVDRFPVDAVLSKAIASPRVAVLVLNGWGCPLTSVAARCTDDRCENINNCLLEWLAKDNKLILGVLYLFGVLCLAGAPYAVGTVGSRAKLDCHS